jgi:hypothetical protein
VPGIVLAVQGARLIGCAWHPRFRAYHVLVHLVAGAGIVASVIADEKLDCENLPAEGIGHGFIMDLGSFERAAHAVDPRLLIGETDEWFDVPGAERALTRAITVEEIVAVPNRRPWVSGKIYFDALLAGRSTETIVDLFFRDCLGRPADPDGLAHYSGRITDGSLTFEALRAHLVNSQEYKLRWQRADAAPGAIFSQPIVLRSGRELNPLRESGGRKETRVSLRRLMRLSDIDFIASAYRELLGMPPAGAALWRHVAELRAGRQRLDIVRELNDRPAAVARKVLLSDPIDDPEVPKEPASENAMPAKAIGVSPADLLRLRGRKFLTESCRRILGRQPSTNEAAYCLGEATPGRRLDILRYLAGEPEAIARNVRLVEPAGSSGTGRRPSLDRRKNDARRLPEVTAPPRARSAGIGENAGDGLAIAHMESAPIVKIASTAAAPSERRNHPANLQPRLASASGRSGRARR